MQGIEEYLILLETRCLLTELHKNSHTLGGGKCMAALGSYILFYILNSLNRARFPYKTIFCDMYHTISYPLIMALIRGRFGRKFKSTRILMRG